MFAKKSDKLFGRSEGVAGQIVEKWKGPKNTSL